MKELSIEEKARAYDEALKRAKDIHRFSSDLAEIKRMEYIFPKLRESEDERIRKVLVGFFKSYKEQGTCGSETFNEIPTDNILAWLEKQGGQKTKWSDEDEHHWMMCLECVEECATQEREDFSKTIGWIKSLKQKLKE